MFNYRQTEFGDLLDGEVGLDVAEPLEIDAIAGNPTGNAATSSRKP